jgi:hypothetical protein
VDVVAQSSLRKAEKRRVSLKTTPGRLTSAARNLATVVRSAQLSRSISFGNITFAKDGLHRIM